MRDRSADESPMSVGTTTIGVRGSRTPPSAWLADALQALAELDDEIVEGGLPEHSWAPTVYPTQDAEVAIHFKSPDSPSSVVVLLDNHGRGECYAYTRGHSRRVHYGASSDLPDGFVMEQLCALRPERDGSLRYVDGGATAC